MLSTQDLVLNSTISNCGRMTRKRNEMQEDALWDNTIDPPAEELEPARFAPDVEIDEATLIEAAWDVY